MHLAVKEGNDGGGGLRHVRQIKQLQQDNNILTSSMPHCT